MIDENKNELSPDEEPVTGSAAGEEEREVVSWYSPKDDAQEVVDCYVQPNLLPTGMWKEAAEKEKKKRRHRGIWIFSACVVLLLAVVIFAGWGEEIFGNKPHQLPKGDDSASSIIEIFRNDEETTIPRVEGDPAVRLICAERQGEELSAREIYEKVNPSVVTVVAEEGEGASVGTGVIMSEDGYIVTNAHVISGGESCFVVLYTGASCEAWLVGMDEDEDLAVLKIDAEGLSAAEFGNSDLMAVGDTAYAIGNPLGVELRSTMTDGIISAVEREVEIDGKTVTALQTTAALNNGNSGGPLINSAGQVIGINTLKMGNTDSAEASVEGLGFALPISEASFVINDLIAVGEFRGTPTIGVTVITQELTDGTAVVVYSVEQGFGAAEAGIQKGDVIMAADGKRLETSADLLAVRRDYQIGDTVTLTIFRGDMVFDVEVTLRPNK